jgi:peptidyl-prolyl cis-trans isomerase B (cyclophilin B)
MKDLTFSLPAVMTAAMSETPANSVNTADEVAIISTTLGDMTVAFWSDVAPNTVANFKKLAREGFYDGTAFHRIIRNFMIQGGCPNSKIGATGTPGTGGPGYTIKQEFNRRRHLPGVLSMARSSDPDSAGSQFFICHGDATFLDRNYTAFGELIAGNDVLDKIAATPVRSSFGGENSQPTERVEILSVKIVPAA